jgi:hypothetical protein
MFAAFWSGAAGHGNYVVARLLLPFACLAMTLGRPIASWTVVFASFQFAVYGWLLSGPRWKTLAAIVLGLHLLLVGVLFRASFEAFN